MNAQPRLPLFVLLLTLLFLVACGNPAQEMGSPELPERPKPPIPTELEVTQTLPDHGNWILFDSALRTEQGSADAWLLFDVASSEIRRWEPDESKVGETLPETFPAEAQVFAFQEHLLAVAPSGEHFFISPALDEGRQYHWWATQYAIDPASSEVLLSLMSTEPEGYVVARYNWVTGERVDVTSGEGEFKQPAIWLPGGERLAFIVGDGLHVVNRDGSDETTLVAEEYNVPMAGMSVSPEGDALFFGNMDGIYRVDPESGEVTTLGDAVLTSDDTFFRQRMSLSPDGQMVAYADRVQNGEGTLALLPVDGSDAQPLVTFQTNNQHLLALGDPLDLQTDVNNADVLWSPDSEQLLFLMAKSEDCFAVVRQPGGGKDWHYGAECQYGFYTVPATGGEPTPLTDYKVWRAEPLIWMP